MNEVSILIPIQMIGPNPYQLRQAEDPTAVAELAENIERNTLLQPPTVRQTGTGEENYYELAFGHTRLAAFKLLVSQGKAEYEKIPCFVRELDDLQMFELAVAENIKRRDLNPIERATAMHTYMQRFKKTSAETGEFFNCDEATVRGTVRLLGLPETARQALSKGAITVGASRQLLTLARIAPEHVEAATEKIMAGEQPTAAIMSQLRYLKSAIVLNQSYDKGEPKAGHGLWKLDHPTAKSLPLPKLDPAQAQDAGAIGKEGGKRKKEIGDWINQLEGGLVAPEALIAQGAPAETIEKLAHLLNPPSCDQCSYHIQSEGMHVCGWKNCWERKRATWGRLEAEKLSKKLEIPVYDPERDGEYVAMERDWNDEQQETFKACPPGLRLLAVDEVRSYGNYPFTGSPLVKLINVAPEAVQAAEEEKIRRKEKEAHREESLEQENEERQILHANQELSEQFLEIIAGPVFASILEPIQNEKVLRAMVELICYGLDEDEVAKDESGVPRDEKQRKHFMRCAMIERMFDADMNWEIKGEGPEKTAEHLQSVASDWGVTLPGNWLELARNVKPEEEVEEVKEEEAA
jgi:ParB/RepB/Spo0J family partition protein